MRATSLTRRRPRLAPQVFGSLDAMLVDRASIERRVRQPATAYGTPRFAVQSWGPFPARLSTPSGAPQRQPDRWSTNESWTLVLQSSMPPVQADYLTVRSGRYGTLRFHAQGISQMRDAAWGEILLYHIELGLPVEGLQGELAEPMAASPSAAAQQVGRAD